MQEISSVIPMIGSNQGQTHPPPAIDITQAAGRITSACASTSGSAKPVTTIIDVINRPKSIAPDPSSAAKSSFPQCAKRAFGSGATTNVSAAEVHKDYISGSRKVGTLKGVAGVPTRRGSQFAQSAHERMMRRNPSARTNDRSITAETMVGILRGYRP